MSYAVRRDGKGWRAVNSANDCNENESFSENIPPPSQYLIDSDALLHAKNEKLLALNSITVTTSSGKVFDGNDLARINMLSTITAANFIGQTTANWKLADNTIELVTLDELNEALALSIQRYSEIVTAI